MRCALVVLTALSAIDRITAFQLQPRMTLGSTSSVSFTRQQEMCPARADLLMLESDVEKIVAQVKSNINEGELSTRGEGWFVGQAALLAAVVFAPPEPVQPAVEVSVGLASMALGLALGASAVSDLGFANLTPWPKPVEKNELRTSGIYTLCRHPMYTALISLCFGLSLLDQSFERLLLTVALFALLSFKAGREEAFLEEKHGDDYRVYSSSVPQFFPTVAACWDLLRQ